MIPHQNGRLNDVKRFALILALTAAASASGFAQEILTADLFMRQLSARYSEIKDYEAELVVTTERQTMKGVVAYKAPTLMRVDFSEPAEQVIVYNGTMLTVYVPELRAKLTQQTGTTNATAAASGEGLRMLTRSYSAVYESGPIPTPLPDSEMEMVIRLVLSRLTVAEGFRTITLSVDPEAMLIRRMEGVTLAGDLITYDYLNTRVNQGINDMRFLYDSPASANTYNNFLFSTEN